MTADQKDDQKVFQQKQRELLMSTRDLSQHSIHADVADLEESLQRGAYYMSYVRIAHAYDDSVWTH